MASLWSASYRRGAITITTAEGHAIHIQHGARVPHLRALIAEDNTRTLRSMADALGLTRQGVHYLIRTYALPWRPGRRPPPPRPIFCSQCGRIRRRRKGRPLEGEICVRCRWSNRRRRVQCQRCGKWTPRLRPSWAARRKYCSYRCRGKAVWEAQHKRTGNLDESGLER